MGKIQSCGTCHAARIGWNDHAEAIPAFLTLIGIPLSYSIADGRALGFIAEPLIKALCGRARQIRALPWALAAALLACFIFIRGRMP
jgi:AGZA family xanthine/uracil permease-like MFS transporter